MDAKEGGGLEGLGAEPTLMDVDTIDSSMQQEIRYFRQAPDGGGLPAMTLSRVLENHWHPGNNTHTRTLWTCEAGHCPQTPEPSPLPKALLAPMAAGGF